MTEDRPWSCETLSSAAGVNESYIRRLLIAGKLTGYKIGNAWAIPREVGEQWLAERRAKWDNSFNRRS